MSVKNYENHDIKVTWEAPICMHSTRCWKELKSVFKPLERPWVDLDGADAARIVAQIDRCPSGALKYELKKEAAQAADSGTKNAVMLVQDGPMLMSGGCTISLPDGTTEVREGNVALCRCGASGNKPFCDGAHKKAGFQG